MRRNLRQLRVSTAAALILVIGASHADARSDVERTSQGTEEYRDIPYGSTMAPIDDPALRRCQRALAKNGGKFADEKFRLVQKCLDNFNKGKLSDFLPRECAMADPKTRQKIADLKAKAQAGIRRKCTDDCLIETIGEDICTESGSDNCGSGKSPDMVSGLVGYWPMDELTEMATKDLVSGKDGRFEHGTPELVPGKIGSGALRFFDSCYLNSGLSERLDITQAITVAAWLKKDKDGRKGRIVSRLGYSDDGNGGWAVLYGRNDTNIEWGISTDGVDWMHGYTSKGSVPYDQWCHIAVTYDGSVLRAYINGQEDIAGDFPLAVGGPIHLSKAELLIGQDRAHGQVFGGPKTWSWTGLMDDVRLYNRALNAADVAALYAWKGDGTSEPFADRSH
jgi:Concanavalin A-like lectin/glucanases superfamily